jgi:hypothetical protein
VDGIGADAHSLIAPECFSAQLEQNSAASRGFHRAAGFYTPPAKASNPFLDGTAKLEETAKHAKHAKDERTANARFRVFRVFSG